MAEVFLPTYTDRVDQRFFIEPSGGPVHPKSLLDRFPDELYNKGTDSHFIRFMYSLLGPAGVGWLKKNYLEAKLKLLDQGFETFDMERYYGDPFRFGRILTERFDEDPLGLLSREDWNRLKARDEAYRSRSIAFFNAARLGTSPEGMRLAAESGVGHGTEIVENYKYLFDIHSDEPKGIEYFGTTFNTEEFIVLPRLEIGRSEQQVLYTDGAPSGGTFTLTFDGQTTAAIPYDVAATGAPGLQQYLEALPNIGTGNVYVAGGNGIANDVDATMYYQPYIITFVGALAGQNVPLLQADGSALTGGNDPHVDIDTIIGGIDASDVPAYIEPNLRHNLQVALDYLRPVNTIFTTSNASGLRTRQDWTSVTASSSYTEVLRYVLGGYEVNWPETSSVNWIEGGVEKEAPRIQDDRQHHYTGWHTPEVVRAYSGDALEDADYEVDTGILTSYASEHIGTFDRDDQIIHPFLRDWTDPLYLHTADRSLADYPEPLTVTTQAQGTGLVNGIYPVDYADLAGTATIKYKDDQFWASVERTSGTEILEIDLGEPQPINFLVFEAMRKPVDIELAFDVLDMAPMRQFVDATPVNRLTYPTATYFATDVINPWESLEFHFTGADGRMPFTRFLRLKFTRRTSEAEDGVAFSHPWAICVRNLRVGRNVVV